MDTSKKGGDTIVAKLRNMMRIPSGHDVCNSGMALIIR